MSKPTAHQLARLAWQCRRGVLELDLLLERFLHHHYPTLSDVDQQRFQSILRYPDAMLMPMLLHGAPCENPEHAALLEAIAAFQPHGPHTQSTEA